MTDKNQPLVSKAKLLTSTARIEAAIKAAVTNAKSVQMEYQLIACSAILHLGTHKDIRVIRNILDTMPESLRKVAMATFFDRYAPVAFDEEGQVHYDDDKKVQLGFALEQAWWKTVKETVYTPFVFITEVEKLITKAEKRFDSGVDVEKGDELNAAQIQSLRALIKPATKKAA